MPNEEPAAKAHKHQRVLGPGHSHPHPKQLAPVSLGDGCGNHGGEDHEEAKEDEDDPRVERRLTGVGLVHRQRNIFISLTCFSRLGDLVDGAQVRSNPSPAPQPRGNRTKL